MERPGAVNANAGAKEPAQGAAFFPTLFHLRRFRTDRAARTSFSSFWTHFQKEIAFLGTESSPAFVRLPPPAVSARPQAVCKRKPNYSWAIQVPPDDSRIVAKRVDVPSPQGNGSIRGYLVRPAGTEKLPAVLVVHENRGLNPYIEDVARRLATANFIAFAPDGLTSVGGYPGDDEKGAALFDQVDQAKMQEDFAAAVA